MKIIDVLKICAIYLSRDNISKGLEDIDNADEHTLSQINSLTRLANLVISELAGGFIPMLISETPTFKDNKVYYADLKENFLELVSVSDLSGKEIDYKQTEEFIEVFNKNAIVCYKYLPSNYGLFDKIGYSEKTISAGILAYGVTAEYLLTEKNFDESIMWHDRFVKQINKKIKPKNTVVKKRRFV